MAPFLPTNGKPELGLSASVVFPVKVLSVSLGWQFHEVDHSFFGGWINQEMRMIRHQAVSKDGRTVLFRQFSGPLEIKKPIIFILEYFLTVVSPLDGVMANIGYDKTTVSWHEGDAADFPVWC